MSEIFFLIYLIIYSKCKTFWQNENVEIYACSIFTLHRILNDKRDITVIETYTFTQLSCNFLRKH